MGEKPVQNNGLGNQSPKIHLPQLDGIKGVICFFIIFVHYYNRTPSNAFPITWIPQVLVAKGWMFVEMFFIISGFLFAYSQKSKIQKCEFHTFVLARLKRLYPSVLFVTIFDVFTRVLHMCINHGSDRLTIGGLVKSLTFTTTWLYNEEPFPTVLWYIHVLFLCYILYYFIGKCKDETRYFACIIALVLFGWAIYAKPLSVPFLYKNIGRGYFSFGIGLLIYEFQTKVSEKIRQSVSYCAMVFAALSLILGYFFTFDTVYGDLLLSCTAFLFPTTILCLINIPWVGSIFSAEPLVWLGKLSMSTFLVHVPVMNLIKSICYRSGALPFNEAFTFVVVMLAIFAVSIAWYYLIEKKLIPGFLRLFVKDSA